jgi:Tfp pilus assembly protein PilF
LNSGNPVEAQKDFESVLSLNSSNADALLYKNQCIEYQQKKATLKITELELNSPSPAPGHEEYQKGVEFVRKGDRQSAIKHFKNAVTINPDHIDAHYDLAVSYFTLGQNEQARQEYEIVIKLKPNDVDALNNLGVIYAMNGQLDKAKELFDIALSTDPKFALTYRNLAVYWNSVGDKEKFDKFYQKAVELDPNIFRK